MKKLWNGFKIAFSMYSRIPMPESRWNEENQTYAMVFFPWVGAVVAGVFLGVWQLREWALVRGVLESDLFWSGALVLVPFLITGGIHMDGFMDTRDALSACAPRERRLEILKDPHTGAFAVISCGLYLMAMLGLYGALHWRTAAVTAAGFVLSRILSGLSVVTFPKAKKEGTVAALAEAAGNRAVRRILVVYLILLGAGMGLFGGMTGVAALLCAGLCFARYYWMSRNYFGGITGDLAGYFLQMCELWIAAGAVAMDVVLKVF